MSKVRFNPLEFNTSETGNYVARVPIHLLGALSYELPNSKNIMTILLYLIFMSANKTFMSGESGVKEIEINTYLLEKYLNIPRENVSRSIKVLVNGGWIERTQKSSRKSAAKYKVNFEKLEQITIVHFLSHIYE